MAYDGTYLAEVNRNGPLGNTEWAYHTTDSIATVGAASYFTGAAFSNGTSAKHGGKGLRKGDIITVYVWSAIPTAVESMVSPVATAPTLSYIAKLRVTGIVAATGAATTAPLEFLTGSATLDPASIADGDEVASEVTVTGAALGDFVAGVSFSLDVADLAFVAAVTAADTVTVSILNNTGGAVDLAEGTVRVLVRPRPF